MSLDSMRPEGSKSSWDNKAMMIVALGYPDVADRLPELLCWLQDMNWPGSRIIADFLVPIGSPLIPHVSEILNGKDDDWKYWILKELVSKWDRGIIAQLEPELMRIAQLLHHSDNLDLFVLDLLVKNKLGDLDTFKKQVESKRQTLEYRIHELDEIEHLIVASKDA